MKQIRIYLIFSLIFINGISLFDLINDANAQSITWERIYDNPGTRWDGIEGICEADSGNFFLAGYTLLPSIGYRIWVIKINSYGDTLWTRAIGNSGSQAYSIASSGDGGGVLISWSGTGPVPSSARGVSRVNAVCFNWPPPPPVITASTYQDGTFIRPRILIHSNSTIGDFSYNRIYKANPATGWNYVYIGVTSGTEFIDYSEYI